MNLLYKNTCVNILFIKEKKLLVQVWGKDYAEFKEFKEAIDKTVELFCKHEIEKLISDTRVQPVATLKNTNYAASVIPALMNNGLKKMAFIVSNNKIIKQNISSFTSEANVDIIEIFSNMQEAEKWLDEN